MNGPTLGGKPPKTTRITWALSLGWGGICEKSGENGVTEGKTEPGKGEPVRVGTMEAGGAGKDRWRRGYRTRDGEKRPQGGVCWKMLGLQEKRSRFPGRRV